MNATMLATLRSAFTITEQTGNRIKGKTAIDSQMQL